MWTWRAKTSHKTWTRKKTLSHPHWFMGWVFANPPILKEFYIPAFLQTRGCPCVRYRHIYLPPCQWHLVSIPHISLLMWGLLWNILRRLTVLTAWSPTGDFLWRFEKFRERALAQACVPLSVSFFCRYLLLSLSSFSFSAACLPLPCYMLPAPQCSFQWFIGKRPWIIPSETVSQIYIYSFKWFLSAI